MFLQRKTFVILVSASSLLAFFLIQTAISAKFALIANNTNENNSNDVTPVNSVTTLANPVTPLKTPLKTETKIGVQDQDGITIKELLFQNMSTLLQNDSRILAYIRDHHLTPPSPLPYNLSNPGVDEGLLIGLIPTIKSLLKNKNNGFFIEAGSNDGEHISSTLGFERFQSWTGLCVEPSPAMQPIWRSKHRKAWFTDVCLSSKTFPLWTSFLHRDGYSIASRVGRPEDLAAGESRASWTVYKVPCFPLFSILSAMGVTEVDFFNLDVEGVELDVLKTIPFSEILFRTISVEMHPSTPNPIAAKALMDFMTGQGFTIALKRHPDYIFAHPSVTRS